MLVDLAIEEVSISTIENSPGIDALLAEYAAECAIDGMPPPTAKWHTYRTLQMAGVLYAFGAFAGEELIGFIFVLTSHLPHYATAPAAVSESFFVARAHRKSGAGLKLLRIAEETARKAGAPGLIVAAPFEGDLYKVLPRMGYAEVSRAFFKKVGT